MERFGVRKPNRSWEKPKGFPQPETIAREHRKPKRKYASFWCSEVLLRPVTKITLAHAVTSAVCLSALELSFFGRFFQSREGIAIQVYRTNEGEESIPTQ